MNFKSFVMCGAVLILAIGMRCQCNKLDQVNKVYRFRNHLLHFYHKPPNGIERDDALKTTNLNKFFHASSVLCIIDKSRFCAC